jgi:hypothetical protein
VNKVRAVNKVRFPGVEDTFKRLPLQPEYVDALHAGSSRVADHVHEAVERMQPAER